MHQDSSLLICDLGCSWCLTLKLSQSFEFVKVLCDIWQPHCPKGQCTQWVGNNCQVQVWNLKCTHFKPWNFFPDPRVDLIFGFRSAEDHSKLFDGGHKFRKFVNMLHMTAVIPTQTIPVWTSHAIKIHHLWRWTSSRTTLRSSASLGTLVALHFSQAFLNHMFPFLRMSPPGTSSCSFFTLSGAYRSIDFRRRLKHQDRNVVGVAHGYPLTKTVPMFETWGKI